jgi:putative Mg2+ transporter-C (MgtC) family protein
MEQLFGLDNFNILPHAVALLIAYALAFPLGWNREKEERSAGLRTFPLVAIASCGLIQGAESLTADNPEAMARIIEGLITGMGFIGGGAILRLKDSVQGTATAASLWVTGAIGVSAGLGSYDVAFMLSVVAFATLRLMPPLKKITQVDGDEGEATGGFEAPASVKPSAPSPVEAGTGAGHGDARD